MSLIFLIILKIFILIIIIRSDLKIHETRNISERNLAYLQTGSFIINYVTLIMAQDAPKRRFLSLIFLVSLISIVN